jgi:tetratricopeptide (TPR) repeat protein
MKRSAASGLFTRSSTIISKYLVKSMEDDKFEEDLLIFVKQMESFLQQRMLPEALSMAEERLSLLPADVDAQVFINRTLIEMGRVKESRSFLHKLEKEIFRWSFVYLRAADNYRRKGLNQDALSCYQKFLALNPHSERFLEVTEIISSLQKDGSLSAEIDESGGTDLPKPEFYTITLADLYIKQGHLKMATDILEEIIRQEPSNVPARVKLDTVKAAIALKSCSGKTPYITNNLIKTLSCWLENIDRLKKHAT